MFDVLSFLNHYGIEYVESGSSVVKGNVAVKCPFCGDADPSYHMGIRLSDGVWGCWRDATHRGKKPHRLIQALIKCSWQEADTIVGAVIDGSDLKSAIASLSGEHQSFLSQRKVLSLPTTFHPLFCARGYFAERFFKCLIHRGFEPQEVRDLAQMYDLHYCLFGDFAYRLIFPIYENEILQTWTGRAIVESKLRYKTLTAKPSRKGQGALRPITDYLYNFDGLMDVGGRILCIVEGPFDALKVDFYGKSVGVRATCLFGSNISERQFYLIMKLASRFNRLILLLDRDMFLNRAQQVRSRLASLSLEIKLVPEPWKDPGEMTKEAVLGLEG